MFSFNNSLALACPVIVRPVELYSITGNSPVKITLTIVEIFALSNSCIVGELITLLKLSNVLDLIAEPCVTVPPVIGEPL